MKKCCFIVPYFGKLPTHFEVFVKTCKNNVNYDWIIFSDDKEKYDLPDNVKIINMSFNELQELIQSKFSFKISLQKPYKLCDYKPAYGYIFEKYIPTEKYKFWGHCDLDIIIGNLDKFLTDEILEKYDKLFCLGHMILYKNTYENNRIFMQDYNGKILYKEAFSTNEITVFDETHGGRNNVNSIFETKNKLIYTKDLALNIKILPTKFTKVTFDYKKYDYDIEPYKKAIYIWEKGNLYRIFLRNNQLIREDFLYAHFQQRKMKFDKKILKLNQFKIVPNAFKKLEVENVNLKNFKKVKRNILCIHFWQLHFKWKKQKIEAKIKNREKK